MNTSIRNEIGESIECKRRLLDSDELIKSIELAVESCLNSLRTGGKVIFAGNGGSFADAQHLSAEFVSRFMFDRDPLASIALGVNGSVISAVGNDYGYEQVFARELAAVGAQNDTIFAISTSGNSPNILKLVEVANEKNIQTFGLTGLSGGKLVSRCHCLQIPSDNTARIQESHILIGHIICGLVEKQYFRP